MEPDSQRWGKNIHASLENRPFQPSVTQNGLILNHARFCRIVVQIRTGFPAKFGCENAALWQSCGAGNDVSVSGE
jgi:hypothetical protein